MSLTTMSPQALSKLIEDSPGIELIDVRTPVEFQEVHVKGARNVPLDRLKPGEVQSERNGTAEEPLYLICQSGNRADLACRQFLAAGYTQVVNIAGGTQACAEAGLEVVRGKKAVSLERQVRIAAGALVLLGVVLGSFVHPYFIGLSAFVGAGLMFAGITDTCAMGMLIARMPWNQVSKSCQV
jgi:rhodanese-related sulfurtransferase